MLRISKKGQNAVEYLLLFAAVLVILIVVLRPKGIMTKAVNQSLTLSFEGLDIMVNNISYNVYNEAF